MTRMTRMTWVSLVNHGWLMVAEAHMLTCWKVLDRRANLAPRAFYMAWLLERAEDSVKTKREIQRIGRSLHQCGTVANPHTANPYFGDGDSPY